MKTHTSFKRLMYVHFTPCVRVGIKARKTLSFNLLIQSCLCFEVSHLQISPQFSTPYLIHITQTCRESRKLLVCRSYITQSPIAILKKFSKISKMLLVNTFDDVQFSKVTLYSASLLVSFKKKYKILHYLFSRALWLSCFRHWMKTVRIQSIFFLVLIFLHSD